MKTAITFVIGIAIGAVSAHFVPRVEAQSPLSLNLRTVYVQRVTEGTNILSQGKLVRGFFCNATTCYMVTGD